MSDMKLILRHVDLPTRWSCLLSLVLGFSTWVPLFAHHNPASHYDINADMVTVTGVITEFKLINPHARIYFDVTTESGEVQPWFAEGNAASVLKRKGWSNDMLKPGTVIKMSGYPARDGSHALDWKLIELEDGTQLRGGNTVGAEKELLLDDIDKRRGIETSDEHADDESH